MFSEASPNRLPPSGEHGEHEHMSKYPDLARAEAKERHKREIAVLKSNIHAVEEWERMSLFERFVMIHERPDIKKPLEELYKELRHLEEDQGFK